ncbi:ABC transporter permease [Kallotenue papyrolyticum]|uniref:ABC transporter permease n=1 Tax=Kallotenue papyrolyticum TaxID=1325125 RepID=UPI0004927AB5|nr:ABC transporter permease [Kallotenue papyrolyticum]
MTVQRLSRSLLRETKASYAFVERNINLVKRYWGWEVVFLLYTIVNALSITFIAKASPEITGLSLSQADVSNFILYLLIGALVWNYISVLFGVVSDTITWERWEGTIEYTFMAPISRLTHLGGTTLFAILYGIVHTAVVLAAISLFFEIDLSNANPWSALALLVLGSFSFVGVGILAAVLPLLFPERGSQMTNVLNALILLVSGVYFPISVLPGWMQTISRFSPAYYVLDGTRQALLHNATIAQIARPYLLPLLVIGIVMVPCGLWVFLSAERFAKRSGRLKRNG